MPYQIHAPANVHGKKPRNAAGVASNPVKIGWMPLRSSIRPVLRQVRISRPRNTPYLKRVSKPSHPNHGIRAASPSHHSLPFTLAPSPTLITNTIPPTRRAHNSILARQFSRPDTPLTPFAFVPAPGCDQPSWSTANSAFLFPEHQRREWCTTHEENAKRGQPGADFVFLQFGEFAAPVRSALEPPRQMAEPATP